MKHPVKITLIILVWLVFSVVLSFLIAPVAISHQSPIQQEMNPFVWLAITIGMILLGAVSWYFLMKKAKPSTVDVVFSLGLGAVASRGISLFIQAPSNEVTELVFRMGLIALCALLVFTMFKTMRKSWQWTVYLTPISNAVMVWITVVAATIIGVSVPWTVTFALLGVASIYDAWAVWKSKTMIKMANYFIDRRILPGIAVPYKDEERFALLGGGDVFFIALVSSSLYKVDAVFAYSVASGMLLSVVALFMMSKKDTFYPALPFILTGALIGLGVGWLM